jgi:hypothetical protein
MMYQHSLPNLSYRHTIYRLSIDRCLLDVLSHLYSTYTPRCASFVFSNLGTSDCMEIARWTRQVNEMDVWDDTRLM